MTEPGIAYLVSGDPAWRTRRMTKIAYYIPATTDKTDRRCVGPAAEGRCTTAIQSNNPEVDDRGYIHIADRANTGLHTSS